MSRTVQEPEAVVCDTCRTIPISYLSLDLDEPIIGWPVFLRERNIEVAPDDLGRPSVQRRVLGALLSEREEQEARVALQRVEQAAAQRVTVPAGVPAVEGATPFESLVAAGGVTTTPAEEFGRRPRPNFLDEELAAGRKQAAYAEAEREAVDHARKVLDGRADK